MKSLGGIGGRLWIHGQQTFCITRVGTKKHDKSAVGVVCKISLDASMTLLVNEAGFTPSNAYRNYRIRAA